MKKVSTKINEYKEHLKRLHDYQGAPDFQILKWFSQDYSGMNIKYIETIAINNMINREMLKRRLTFKKEEI